MNHPIDTDKVQRILALSIESRTSLSEFSQQYPSFYQGLLESAAGIQADWTDQQREEGIQRVLDTLGLLLLIHEGFQGPPQFRGLPVILSV